METVTREQELLSVIYKLTDALEQANGRLWKCGGESVTPEMTESERAALSAPPADGEAREHQERLYAMAVDDGETWDLSENDQAACNYGADCIGMLSAVISERDALAAQAPPASDPPGLVEVVAEFQRAHADYQRAKHEDVGQEFAWSARKSARDAVLAYHLPASPQAETKGDE